MFDAIIKEVGIRFGLDSGKAATLVQMLLAYMTDKNTDGLNGFMDKLKQAGAGAAAQSWLGDAATAMTAKQPVGPEQVRQVLGGTSGLLGSIGSKLGIGNRTLSSVVAFVLPLLICKLTPQGTVSVLVPREVAGFIDRAPSPVSHPAIKLASGSVMKWLPWVLMAAGTAFVLNDYSTPVVDGMKGAVAVTSETAMAAARAVADEIPTGAGVLEALRDGAPALEVYFETGRTNVSSEFIASVKPLVEHLKSHPDASVVVSGFSDPRGHAANSDDLSKQRAAIVADALRIAGVARARIVFGQPVDIRDPGETDAESRCIEVVIRK